ncbi:MULTISPECIES: BNR repeat-containing protein [unclassified Saccharicrinis]|uniref:BNR repeat-containing protein n=1 Tax=unclassified Saccharicrinis TaxID=2646859 RepID=UPI003D32D108
MKFAFITLCLQFIMSVTILAQVKVVQHNTSLVDSAALTVDGRFASAINGRTFQKDAIVSYNNYQYFAYYDKERHVCLSRRKLDNGNWETIRFTDYFFESNDAHNVVSMGICPNDGTIHLAFDHHVHPLHYRVSKKGLTNKPESMEWNTSMFTPVLSELEENKPIKITYPKFWQTPDGNLQFNYRVRGSGNGDRMLVDYDAKNGKWENTRQIDAAQGYFKDQLGESETRCSYPNGYDYDAEGNLHVTWVWREDSKGANHDLIYVYSEDKGFTWRNNAGELLNDIPNVNSPGIVVQSIPRVLGLMNDHGQAIDSEGRMHVVMYHCTEQSINEAGSVPGATRWGPPGAQRYHHYWRDLMGEWHHFEMDLKVGNRPKIFIDKMDNLIMIFSGIDEKNIKRVTERDKDLVVAIATAKNNWKDWHVAHAVEGPFLNDMLGDFYRWKSEGILSVIVQDKPKASGKPSPLKVIDFSFCIE